MPSFMLQKTIKAFINFFKNIQFLSLITATVFHTIAKKLATKPVQVYKWQLLFRTKT